MHPSKIDIPGKKSENEIFAVTLIKSQVKIKTRGKFAYKLIALFT